MTYYSMQFGKKFLCFGIGAGLGNRLLTWARCRIFSNIHGGTVITPIWARPALGQILRGGVDYPSYCRQIALWGLFQKRAGDMGVFAGYFKTRLLKVIDEPSNLNDFPNEAKDKKIIFQHNASNSFQPLNGWSDFLYNELRVITKKKYLALADKHKSIPVGIVVRCGNDFDDPASDESIILKRGEKTPVKWFARMLQVIRNEIGVDVEAYIVSDGTRQQLAELLAMKNTHFVRPGSAISDLLTISRAKVLLAAGSSSFAAWASFLGQMPSASHPGQPLTAWNIIPTRQQFIGEVNPHHPDPNFIEQVKQALIK
ncbi:MAG: hypothetical protein Q8L78_04620 [Coxiellaceae bacterium]|nr:hypothetical protein [Coxiellaceae bacterium]